MAISGLREVAGSVTSFGTDTVGVAVEALDVLGLVQDRDQLRESIASDYATLTEAAGGLQGELYIDLPYNQISTNGLIVALDNRFEQTHPKTYVYENLWVPGYTKGSYTDEQLAQGSAASPQVRLAIRGRESADEPLLHFLDRPIDDYAKEKWGGEDTQLQGIQKTQAAFEIDRPDITLSALSVRDVAFMSSFVALKVNQCQ